MLNILNGPECFSCLGDNLPTADTTTTNTKYQSAGAVGRSMGHNCPGRAGEEADWIVNTHWDVSGDFL